jgi:protoporphyrinogen oxidase
MDRILILGGGPTGLGAAFRLAREETDWLLLEREPTVGGLAASFREQGFTWDIGGHVLFSHYPLFDGVMDEVLPVNERLVHQRIASVKVGDRFIPYPFQYNIGFLPQAAAWQCIEGLLDLHLNNTTIDRSSFQRYIETHFGKGIGSIFMLPYNRKVWAHPLEKLSCNWLNDRVAAIDLKKVLYHAFCGKANDQWGPNNTFFFPRNGGTGAIWQRLASRLPAGKVRLTEEAVAIDPSRHEVTTRQGTVLRYDYLISTIPLDRVVALSGQSRLTSQANRLQYTHTHVIGIGIRGTLPPEISRHGWIYYPEAGLPFYRSTVFSNYSPANAPQGHQSIMVEIAEPSENNCSRDEAVDRALKGCMQVPLVGSEKQIAQIWYSKAEYGYPIPTIDRDEILDSIQPSLEQQNIFSRGRFGAWKYEIGNMDHSFMQGYEAAERILTGSREKVLNGVV